MAPARDITGLRSGKLAAVKYAGYSTSRSRVWECSCDCGGTKNVEASSLVSKNVQSCGCLPKGPRAPVRKWLYFGKYMTIMEILHDSRCIIDHSTLHTRLYRGVDPTLAATKKSLRTMVVVDGKEITQKEFLALSGEPVSLKKFNNRIKELGMTPANAILNQDYRENPPILAFGELKLQADWARDDRCNCHPKTLWHRLKKHLADESMPIEEIICKPSLKKRFVYAWGEKKSVSDWAKDKRCQCSFGTLWQRIDRGYHPEKAISTPPDCHEMRMEKESMRLRRLVFAFTMSK